MIKRKNREIFQGRREGEGRVRSFSKFPRLGSLPRGRVMNDSRSLAFSSRRIERLAKISKKLFARYLTMEYRCRGSIGAVRKKRLRNTFPFLGGTFEGKVCKGLESSINYWWKTDETGGKNFASNVCTHGLQAVKRDFKGNKKRSTL